ncbi:PLP-dependent transferase [Testicularia cyperi]|uniref:PLP-dependent transferase n=1 Tax=Testicularia cyperi TaxID=1882483 RepID=A0A317XSW4_9BASI|nr:PLP-dependent transferase [Testicularia cyperi]
MSTSSTTTKKVTIQDKITQHREAFLSKPFPGFGHALKEHFGFDADYVQVNNGSFGACPNYVMEIYKEWLYESERQPDQFLRVESQAYLLEARTALSKVVGCGVEDLVLVPNATHGVNAVLRGLNGTWAHRDAILVFNTIYGACGKAVQYMVDSNPEMDLQVIHVTMQYPLSHAEFLNITRQTIEEAQAKGIRIKIAVLDAISSLPGVVVPWVEVCSMLKEHQILSLVDGAHAVGQIPLNLSESDPDFFISNCHKWLSCHRGVAFLYAPKRTQHLVPGIPTSHNYVSPNLPKPTGPALVPNSAPSEFVAMWEWTGTKDLGNELTIPAALEFREWMGGESAILQYNSTLAFQAGKLVAQRLGNGSLVMETPNTTSAQDEDEDEKNRLTAAMVNVSIPLPESTPQDQLPFLAAKIQKHLMQTFPTFAPFYVHNGKVWTRLSAQVWLQIEDFEWVADRILDTLKALDLVPDSSSKDDEKTAN